MNLAPILVPDETDTRFMWGDASHAAERLPIPRAFDLGAFLAPEPFAPAMEFHVVERKLYRSPALAWEGYVFARRQDEDRILAALRAAEWAILFVAWIRAVAVNS